MIELEEKQALQALVKMIRNVNNAEVHDVLSLMLAVLIMHSHYIHNTGDDC